MINRTRRNLLTGNVNQNRTPNRLPWVINEQIFINGCTKCGDCLNVCETNIISVDNEGYPEVDLSKAECTFCQNCVSACQKPLFNVDKSAAPWDLTLVINNNCFAENGVFCLSCKDSCDHSAIKFTYTDSAIPTPSINQQDCTTCGACISVCPQSSIELIPNSKHNLEEELA